MVGVAGLRPNTAGKWYNFFIRANLAIFSARSIEWVLLSKKYIELLSVRPSVSMVTNKMSAVLSKYWQIWKHCYSLLNTYDYNSCKSMFSTQSTVQ